MKIRKRIAFVVLLVTVSPIWAQQEVAQAELIFPYFAHFSESDGRGPFDSWDSLVELFNPQRSHITFKFQTYDSTGRLVSEPKDPITAVTFGEFRWRPGAPTGWMRVTASAPVFVNLKLGHFIRTGNLWQTVCSLNLKPTMPTRHAVLRVYWGSGFNTGIAILFRSDIAGSQTTGRLTVQDANGVRGILAEKQVTIGANQQLVGFITDLIPNLPKEGAYLELTFDKEVHILALVFRNATENTPATCYEAGGGPIP